MLRHAKSTSSASEYRRKEALKDSNVMLSSQVPDAVIEAVMESTKVIISPAGRELLSKQGSEAARSSEGHGSPLGGWPLSRVLRDNPRRNVKGESMRAIGRGKQQWVTLAIVAALYGLSLAWVPTVAAQAGAIQNVGSRKCLQPVDESLDEGAPVIQTTCNGSAFQLWEVIPTTPPPTIFLLRNVGSGKCLETAGGAANHQPINQWTCNWISNERWDSPSQGVLRSRVSGSTTHCLDVPGGTSEDVWVQLYRCNNTFAQYWFLPPIP
jgi:hypothetical protein